MNILEDMHFLVPYFSAASTAYVDMYDARRNVYAKIFLLLEGAFLILSDSLRDIVFHHLFWCFRNSSDPSTKNK